MMTIQLYTEPVILEVRQKSHLEVQNIADPEARYNARAGMDKIEEVHRCVSEGFSQLRRRCLRFLHDDYTTYAADVDIDFPESFVYDFDLSERRMIGKAEPLKDAMHSLVVHYALSKFYSTVSQADLSNKNSLLALEAGNQLDELLYTKLPPR